MVPTDLHQQVFLNKYERRHFWPKWLINLSLELYESESDETDPFSKLPVEICEEILKDFDPSRLAKCSIVSSRWRKIANSNKLWSRICKKEGWTNVKSLTDIESNFRNTMMQFDISMQPKKIWPTFELMEAEFQEEDELTNKSFMKEGLEPLNNVGNVKEKVVEALCGRNNFLQVSNNQYKQSETSNKKEIQTKEEKEEDTKKEYANEKGVILENGKVTKFGIGNDKLNKEYGDSSDDKLVPISEWKLCYLERKFLEYHWYRGTYVGHYFGDGFKLPIELTLNLSDPYESFLYLPFNELRNGRYELNLCKLDGTPRKVARLECSMDKVKTVSFSNTLIAYVSVDQLKFARPSKVKNTFERFGPFNIIPDEQTDSLKIKLQKYKYRYYFIKMNCKYVISGDELVFIQVWCKNTLEKVCLIECPDAASVFSYITLQSDDIFFVTEDAYNQNKSTIYKYSIVNKTLSKITFLYGKIKKLLVNDIYLIIILTIDRYENEIIVYKHGMEFTDLGSKTRFNQDISENLAVEEPQVLLFKDLLFYLEGCNITIMKLNERFQGLKLHSGFKVGSNICSMHNVLNNLLIIRTRYETEIWDWERRERLYTLDIDFVSGYLVYDCTKLIYVYHRNGEVKLYGFW